MRARLTTSTQESKLKPLILKRQDYTVAVRFSALKNIRCSIFQRVLTAQIFSGLLWSVSSQWVECMDAQSHY